MADSNETLSVKIDGIKELLINHVAEGREDRKEYKEEMAVIHRKTSKHETWINRAYGAMTIIVMLSGGFYTYASYFVQDEIEAQTTELKREILSSREMSELLDHSCDDCFIKNHGNI